MNRKDLLKDIGYKLKKVRKQVNYSLPYMAARLGLVRSSFLRNETGKTCPNIMILRKLGKEFDVSLDWLICDKGQMFYGEKGEAQAEKQPEPLPPTPEPTKLEAGPETKPEAGAKPIPEVMETIPDDIRELVEHMKRIPLLRYEILASFYDFKDKRKDMVAEAMA